MNRDRIKVLIVDDEESIRESLAGWLEKDGYGVEVAPDGESAIEKVTHERFAIVLMDLKMPGMDGLTALERIRGQRPETTVVMMTAYATVDTAVSAIKNGAYDYLVKPFDPEELSLTVDRIATQQRLRHENEVLRKALKREARFRELVSRSPSMHACFELARATARSRSTVLVLGESGTGKELLARAIHAESAQSSGPFIAVSCAALTETLLESELFGYEKGAFTGATGRRRGKFELAASGSLFLDEVGDIGLKLQLDLLRVLEERRFCRVGGSEVVESDARIIAATNRDLQKAVADGSFREDLFYRLNVIPIRLPPLRERREDIPLLVDHFLERLAVELKKPLKAVTPDAMGQLLSYPWPGNVRELKNVLERGAVLSTTGLIGPTQLGLTSTPEVQQRGAEVQTLEEVERRHIAFVLERLDGNVTQAARALDIDRATLYAKIRKYGLRKAEE